MWLQSSSSSMEAGCPKTDSLTCLVSFTCPQLGLLAGVSGSPLHGLSLPGRIISFSFTWWQSLFKRTRIAAVLRPGLRSHTISLLPHLIGQSKLQNQLRCKGWRNRFPIAMERAAESHCMGGRNGPSVETVYDSLSPGLSKSLPGMCKIHSRFPRPPKVLSHYDIKLDNSLFTIIWWSVPGYHVGKTSQIWLFRCSFSLLKYYLFINF